jgi:hypothetical protein
VHARVSSQTERHNPVEKIRYKTNLGEQTEGTKVNSFGSGGVPVARTFEFSNNARC